MSRWLVVLRLGCSGSPCGPETAVVARAVDGDTVVLSTGEKVRYLNVDAPETTQGHHDCFGVEAADFNASLVEGREVSLRYDGASCSDRYGRLLAWLSVDGVEVNRELVTRGLACALSVPPGGQGRDEEFSTLESEAKTARRGMWGACVATPCDG
jgi:micrococcal nuclease